MRKPSKGSHSSRAAPGRQASRRAGDQPIQLRSPSPLGEFQPGSDPIRRYDPYALVLDSNPELVREAHDLTGHGFEVEVINDLDTASTWLEIQRDRPGVVLLAADLDEKAADAVVSKIAPGVSGGCAALVLVGAVASRADARHLADLGFQWLVRRPFTLEELHLAASAAIGAGNWADTRRFPRVPVHLRVDVARPGSIDSALVCDLSAGGLFLAMANPPEVGEALIIEMALGANDMLLRGIATHRSHRATPGGEFGVGVRFENLEESAGRSVADYVEARLGSVRL